MKSLQLAPYLTEKVATTETLKIAKLWKKASESLLALQEFMSTHPAWFNKLLFMDKIDLDTAIEQIDMKILN